MQQVALLVLRRLENKTAFVVVEQVCVVLQLLHATHVGDCRGYVKIMLQLKGLECLLTRTKTFSLLDNK